MTNTATYQGRAVQGVSPALLDRMPMRDFGPSNKDVLNAVDALRWEVEQLRETILTPERRLAAAGLHYAARLP